MDSVLQAEGKVDDVTFADVFDRSMDSEAQGSEPRDSCWAAELVSFIGAFDPSQSAWVTAASCLCAPVRPPRLTASTKKPVTKLCGGAPVGRR